MSRCLNKYILGVKYLDSWIWSKFDTFPDM